MNVLAVLALGVLALLLHLSRSHHADWREAIIPAVLAWSLILLVVTEGLSLFGAITQPALILAWAVAGALVLKLTWRRRQFHLPDWRRLAIADWLLLTVIALAVAITWTIAYLALPGTRDSLAYHLARVEFWGQQASLHHFSTPTPTQLSMPPFAEMMILNFNVLTGTRDLCNLVAALAFLGCIAGAAIVAGRLGAGVRGQLTAALLAATAPVAILQASGTKNDLVVGFFLLATYERYLKWRDGQRLRDAFAVGVAMGLAILTKGTAYFFAAPVALAVGLTAIRSHPSRAFKNAAVIAFAVLAINAGHYGRNASLLGTPLGGDFGTTNETFGPSVVISNLVRGVASNLATPWEETNNRLVGAVKRGLDLLGIDADDLDTSFAIPFKIQPWVTHESFAPSPLHTLLVVAAVFGLVVGLIRARSRLRLAQTPLYAYAALVLAGGLLFLWAIKWQPWITRLQLPFFLLTAPLVVLVLQKASAWATSTVQVLLCLMAIPVLFFNFTRPLINNANMDYPCCYTIPASVWTDEPLEVLFASGRRDWVEMSAALDAVLPYPVTRIGLAPSSSSPDYQVFFLLGIKAPNRQFRVQHVCPKRKKPPLPTWSETLATFQPEVLLVYGRRPAPQRLSCRWGGGDYEKIGSFFAEWVTERTARSGVHVYRPAGSDQLPMELPRGSLDQVARSRPLRVGDRDLDPRSHRLAQRDPRRDPGAAWRGLPHAAHRTDGTVVRGRARGGRDRHNRYLPHRRRAAGGRTHPARARPTAPP